MDSNVEETRTLMLQLLDVTQRKTLLALSGIDPERVVFNDNPIWRVRDVVGHIGAWNGEAAYSLRVHAQVIEVRQYAVTCPQCGATQVEEPPAGLEMRRRFGSRFKSYSAHTGTKAMGFCDYIWLHGCL